VARLQLPPDQHQLLVAGNAQRVLQLTQQVAR
jgi:hypothetical protein